MSASGYQYETELQAAGFNLIAGADEVGRGACAGPLVAAAVILDTDPKNRIAGLADSKQLSAKKRESLYEEILEKALAWAIVEISPSECDQLGMQEADLQGMRRAIRRLDPAPDFALTDGFAVPGLSCQSISIWKGDQVSATISAASIIAKVIRDRYMASLDDIYPGYDFAGHKGYCTKAHQQRLDALGPCPIHRFSYANVAKTIRVSQPGD